MDQIENNTLLTLKHQSLGWTLRPEPRFRSCRDILAKPESAKHHSHSSTTKCRFRSRLSSSNFSMQKLRQDHAITCNSQNVCLAGVLQELSSKVVITSTHEWSSMTKALEREFGKEQGAILDH